MEDLLAVLPFGMTFDLLVLKGSTLKEAFEHSVHRYGRGTGELLQVGGELPSVCSLFLHVAMLLLGHLKHCPSQQPEQSENACSFMLALCSLCGFN